MKMQWITPCLASMAICVMTSCDKTRKVAESLVVKDPPRPPETYQGSWVTDLDKTTYAKFPFQPGRVVIVDFHAHRCGPCRQLGPVLETIAGEHKGLVLVGKVDVDNNMELAARAGVSSIPDVRVYRDGKQIDQFVGVPDEEQLRKQVQSYVKGLAPDPDSGKAPPPAGQQGFTIAPMPKDWLPPGMSRR